MGNKADNGLFFSFEGMGGGGKSTVVGLASDWLVSCGLDVVRTREPGGTPLGRRLRSLTVETDDSEWVALPEHERPTGWASAFLFEADRAQTYQHIIIPALKAGKCVLSDRNHYGTYAYQGYGDHLDLDLIVRMNEAAMAGFRPDMTFVLDVDPAIGIARKNNQGEADRFDKRAPDYQQRVREGYLAAAQLDGEKAVIINCHQSIEDVIAEIKSIMQKILQNKMPDIFVGH